MPAGISKRRLTADDYQHMGRVGILPEGGRMELIDGEVVIIEIADSSMVYDRDVKARVYAQLGIREYWLADLNDNALACYSTPEAGAYRRVARFHRGESIAPQALPECAIDVDVLLPE